MRRFRHPNTGWRRTWRGRGALLALGLVMLALLWLAYQLGRFHAGHEFTTLTDERRRLDARVAELDARRDELRRSVVRLEREKQVDREADRAVNARLIRLQSEVLELQEEVAFYRGIVAPKDASRGLQVQRFALEPIDAEQRRYSYRLVLTQVITKNKVARGTIGLLVEGLLDGQTQRIDLRQPDAPPLTFKFRYFQDFEGEITLPEQFVPRRVVVQVSAKGTQFERAYDWENSVTSRATALEHEATSRDNGL